MLLLPVAEERPGEAETDEPCVADVVGIVLVGFEVVAFDVEFVVANDAITGVETYCKRVEVEACFDFAVEGCGDSAVVAVAHDFLRGTRIVAIEDGVVGSEMHVDDVETDTDRWNQVEERVFAKDFPAEHPFCAVAEPACVVKREYGGLCAGFVRGHVGGAWTFGNLGRHEVEVNPSEELLVLRTDVDVQSWIEPVEFRVFGGTGIDGICAVARDYVAASAQNHRVDVVAEVAAHTSEVSADGDEPLDMVLVVKAGGGFGRGVGRKCEGTQQSGQECYFCLHGDTPSKELILLKIYYVLK